MNKSNRAIYVFTYDWNCISTFIVQSKINHYNTVQKPVPTIPFHHNKDTSGPFTFTTAQQNYGNEKDNCVLRFIIKPQIIRKGFPMDPLQKWQEICLKPHPICKVQMSHEINIYKYHNVSVLFAPMLISL